MMKSELPNQLLIMVKTNSQRLGTNSLCLYPPMEISDFSARISEVILMMSLSMQAMHTLWKLKVTASIYCTSVIARM